MADSSKSQEPSSESSESGDYGYSYHVHLSGVVTAYDTRTDPNDPEKVKDTLAELFADLIETAGNGDVRAGVRELIDSWEVVNRRKI